MMFGTGGGDRDDRFEDIYRKYYGRVYRFFRRCGVADGEAQDLAQDTFLRLYEHMDQMRSEQPWSYLQTIARTVILNRIRSRHTQRRTASLVDIDDPDLALDPPAPEGPDYAEQEQQALRRERLRAAIKDLPEGQQKCLRLRLGDMEYDRIGEALQITEDAVKSRLRDAKRQLRKRLTARPPREDEE